MPSMRVTNSKKRVLLLSITVGFILAGAIHTWHYSDMPIVRNSMVYAQIAQSLMNYGTEFSPSKDGYKKALGFPYLSLPFVKTPGMSVGLKVSSFTWTSLWLLAVWVWWRKTKEKIIPRETASMSAELERPTLDIIFLFLPFLMPLFFTSSCLLIPTLCMPCPLSGVYFFLTGYCLKTSDGGMVFFSVLLHFSAYGSNILVL
jgi:hypothetical protein